MTMTTAIRTQPSWHTAEDTSPEASIGLILAKCVTFWLTGFAILAVCFV